MRGTKLLGSREYPKNRLRYKAPPELSRLSRSNGDHVNQCIGESHVEDRSSDSARLGQLFADLKFSGQGREGYKSLVGEADLPVVSASASIHRYRQHWTYTAEFSRTLLSENFGL